MTDSDTPQPPETRRRHPLGLLVALPLLAFSGLFMSWGGAVRWKDCWQVAPWECSTHGDEYGVFPTGDVDVYVGAPGAAAPLAIGSLLAFLAVVALVFSTKPRWLAVVALVLATPLLADARSYWRVALDPQDMTEMWDIGPLAPLFMPVGYVFILGGLFLAAALVAILGPVKQPWKPAERSAWVCVAIVGWGHSAFGLYFTPQILSNSHDDPTWMYTLTGVVTIGAALLLTWSLGRASAATPGEPHKVSESHSRAADSVG